MPTLTHKRTIFASMLLVLLVGTMAAGMWHRHDKSDFENCQICQLGRHSFAQPAPGPEIASSTFAFPYAVSYDTPARQHVSIGPADSRAPPA